MSQPQVTNGAQLMCTFGVAPSVYNVLPAKQVMAGNMPAATIMDTAPMVNVMPFGVCTSIANPTVASATAAALGVLTPMPCIPAPAGPWVPGSSTVLVGNLPACSQGSTLNCAYGGVISVVSPGQMTVTVP